MGNTKNTSKFISLILRHKPETIGISLDEHGWADVQELIDGINASGSDHLDMDILEEIVRTDEKQRYSFNEDHTLIQANQGHSIPVDVELEEKIPPALLYHGTGEKYVSSIDEQGLIPKSRLYVHLSADIPTAKKVGSRHGKPVIYTVDCSKMAAPSLSQAQRIRELGQEGTLTVTKAREILAEIKKGEINRVTFKNEQLYQFFPRNYPAKKMKQDILDILKLWDELKKARAAIESEVSGEETAKGSKETKVLDEMDGGAVPPTEDESEE